MSAKTEISWCDATFNPWWGCAKVSPACDHCYAERDAKRFAPGRVLWGVDSERRVFGDKHWNEPLKWNARAEREGRRMRVFCASMADVFDKDAPAGARARLLSLIADTPHLDWLLLTKRIGNATRMLQDACMHDGRLMDASDRYRPPPNVWLGATVVNQEEADRDIPKLLATPARVRFLSIEPMLGPIDLRIGGMSMPDYAPHRPLPQVSWVIAGGESGPYARPAHPDWFRSLRDRCAAAGVPFHFKQWGEWLPCEVDCTTAAADDGSERELPGDRWAAHTFSDRQQMARIGKRAAGRLLDGVEHNGFPS